LGWHGKRKRTEAQPEKKMKAPKGGAMGQRRLGEKRSSRPRIRRLQLKGGKKEGQFHKTGKRGEKKVINRGRGRVVFPLHQRRKTVIL